MNKLPAEKIMYEALARRDSSYEGVFYVGVRTTGIFCRPTCPAKKPKPENVEYFPSPQEAVARGYRPCLRCRPLDRTAAPPQVVQHLLAAVDRSPSGKLSDAELRDLGVDPSTARRQFKRHFGMTFHAYHRARRMGLAWDGVRNGEHVIYAQVDNGFESASGFWEAFRRTFGSPASEAERIRCLQAEWIDTPLGAMLALADQDGLHLLEFVDRRGLEREVDWLRRRLGAFVVPGMNPHLEKIAEELKRYFDGTAANFTVPLVLAGSAFEQAVWKLLLTIPPGETQSYARLADLADRPGAARAVGRANGRNRLAIVVPCHRLIHSDGTISGYGGGVWRKKWLLDHERRITRPNERQSP